MGKQGKDFWQSIFKNALKCSECGKISSKNNYKKGYIGIFLFKVIICPNCGKVLWAGNKIAEWIFFSFFVWFWEGKVHLNKKNN